MQKNGEKCRNCLNKHKTQKTMKMQNNFKKSYKLQKNVEITEKSKNMLKN